MKWVRWVAAGVALCALAACVRITDGAPTAVDTGTAAPSSKVIPTPGNDLTEPGVLPTERKPIPAGAVTCRADPLPPVGVTASVADPAAPKITVALPTGWSASSGSGDVGVRLQGPDGTWATVTIAPTQLDPAAAFRKYADDALAASTVSTVSVLPAELCGYSGQKLLGSWSTAPGDTVQFGDRLAHIWTNTKNYLVAVHVQGPADAAGFDPSGSPLMDDFAIVIP